MFNEWNLLWDEVMEAQVPVRLNIPEVESSTINVITGLQLNVFGFIGVSKVILNKVFTSPII